MNLEKMLKKIKEHKEELAKVRADLMNDKSLHFTSYYVAKLRSAEGFLAYLEKEFKGIADWRGD